MMDRATDLPNKSPDGNSSNIEERPDAYDWTISLPLNLFSDKRGAEKPQVHHNYHDYSEVPDDSEFTPSFSKGGVTKTFPIKLYDMLAASEANQSLKDIMRWLPHGRCFIVSDTKEITKKLLPTFFDQNKYASFQRQLNLYGFKRLTKGPDQGSYYHELFLRGKRFLTRRMKRMKIKGNGTRLASNPDEEPNFYTMPYLPPITCNGHLSSNQATNGRSSSSSSSPPPHNEELLGIVVHQQQQEEQHHHHRDHHESINSAGADSLFTIPAHMVMPTTNRINHHQTNSTSTTSTNRTTTRTTKAQGDHHQEEEQRRRTSQHVVAGAVKEEENNGTNPTNMNQYYYPSSYSSSGPPPPVLMQQDDVRRQGGRGAAPPGPHHCSSFALGNYDVTSKEIEEFRNVFGVEEKDNDYYINIHQNMTTPPSLNAKDFSDVELGYLLDLLMQDERNEDDD